MEPMIPQSLVLWIFGAIATLLGGCWAIFKYFEYQINTEKKGTAEKLERLYERMDENKKGYYNDFVLKAVLKESNDARKEIIDQKFEGLIQLFNEKLDGMKVEIRNLANKQ